MLSFDVWSLTWLRCLPNCLTQSRALPIRVTQTQPGMCYPNTEPMSVLGHVYWIVELKPFHFVETLCFSHHGTEPCVRTLFLPNCGSHEYCFETLCLSNRGTETRVETLLPDCVAHAYCFETSCLPNRLTERHVTTLPSKKSKVQCSGIVCKLNSIGHQFYCKAQFIFQFIEHLSIIVIIYT